jgi:hypothetical protein
LVDIKIQKKGVIFITPFYISLFADALNNSV